MKRERKKEKNIFTETDKRNDTTHFVVSRQWPDRTRFRRRLPNLTLARDLLARINGAIVSGTWQALRAELKELPKAPEKPMTMTDLAERYYRDWCAPERKHNTENTAKLKTMALNHIREILGDVLVKDFKRSMGYDFQRELSEDLQPGSVNVYCAVLIHMFSYALDQEIIDAHPLTHFKKLLVDERAMRIMVPHEERQLVEATMERDRIVGVYAGILGETGLRRMEGLKLAWTFVNLDEGFLTVAASKNHKTRQVPLSDYAIELFKSLPRTGPHCFPALTAWGVYKPLDNAIASLGWNWVRGWHDFRHYRATQWIVDGMDVVAVQHLLGHKDLKTTQRYVHYVAEHVKDAAKQAEQRELARLAKRPE